MNYKLAMFFAGIARFFDRIGMYFFTKFLDAYAAKVKREGWG